MSTNSEEHMYEYEEETPDFTNAGTFDVGSVPAGPAVPFREDVLSNPFVVGFDITSAEELAKRQERMGRFESEEVHEVGVLEEDENEIPLFPESLTPSQLGHLPEAVVDKENHNFDPAAERRWDTIHLFGSLVSVVKTEDIMRMFQDYGPTTVEWIDDFRCNVKLGDKSSAKRLLYVESVRSVRNTRSLFNFLVENQITVNFTEEDMEYIVWNKFNPSPSVAAHMKHPLSDKRNLCLRVATVFDVKDSTADRVPSQFYKKNKAYFNDQVQKRNAAAREREAQGKPGYVPLPVDPVLAMRVPELPPVEDAIEEGIVRRGRGFLKGRQGIFDSVSKHLNVSRAGNTRDREYTSRDNVMSQDHVRRGPRGPRHDGVSLNRTSAIHTHLGAPGPRGGPVRTGDHVTYTEYAPDSTGVEAMYARFGHEEKQPEPVIAKKVEEVVQTDEVYDTMHADRL